MLMGNVVRRIGDRVIESLRTHWRQRSHVTLGIAVEGGRVDRIDVDPSGRVRLIGWTAAPAPPQLSVAVNGTPARSVRWFELSRQDLSPPRRGFCIEFAGPCEGLARTVTVHLDGREVGRLEPLLPLHEPHYAALLDEERVLHRTDIYGVGPPSPLASAEIVAMARRLPGPILDFGCGSGALVRELRAAGLETVGLELSRREIVCSLRDDVRPYVTLYDGALPSPFPEGTFESVVCTEVLEHIPEYELAAKELARVAPRALVTVPDMSAIPTLFPHSVVPWHLLEATHVNFFTQPSLERLLRRFFAKISFSRIGAFQVNGTEVFTSLVAHCER